jgi:hypothetical protein
MQLGTSAIQVDCEPRPASVIAQAGEIGSAHDSAQLYGREVVRRLGGIRELSRN